MTKSNGNLFAFLLRMLGLDRLDLDRLQPLGSRRKPGFSVVELMVCVAIIALLASYAFFLLTKRIDKAKYANTATIARMINASALDYRSQTGDWPKDSNNGIAPPELLPYLRVNYFATDTPLGGKWDWNTKVSPIQQNGVSIRYATAAELDRNVLVELDRLIDDGNLAKGNCLLLEVSKKFYFQFCID
jgi:prepilin-type N-terminal cleavage/methylation domain-containing protein